MTHMSATRLRLALAIVIPVSCVVVATAKRVPPGGSAGTRSVVPGSTWVDTDEDLEPGSIAKIIFERFEFLASPEGWPGSDQAIARDVELVVVCLASDDSSAYFERRSEQGLVPNADQVRSLVDQYARWGLSEPLTDDAIDHEGLLRELWASNASRLMRIRAIDTSDVLISTAGAIDLATPVWPYEGIRSCSSVFRREAGPFRQAEGDELIAAGKAVLVQLGVEFADESHGHLALRYFWDDATSQWCPVSISVGSESVEAWPWPAF